MVEKETGVHIREVAVRRLSPVEESRPSGRFQ
jgi:hypothetical protein